MDDDNYIMIRIDSGSPPPIAFLHKGDDPVTKFETYNLSKVNLYNPRGGEIIKMDTNPPTLQIKKLGIRLKKIGNADIYKSDLPGTEIDIVREFLKELSD